MTATLRRDYRSARSGNKASSSTHWAKAKVGELFRVVGGGTPPTSNPEFWNGDIPWITSADIDARHNVTPRRHITPRAIESSATNLVPKGSIVVVTRVGLGKVAEAKEDLCFSQDCHGLLFDQAHVNPRFAVRQLSRMVQDFRHISRGTTINGVTKKQLLELDFLLPPIEDQLEIVAEIEKQFSRLDEAVAGLKRGRASLKRFKAATLRAAFDGLLVDADSGLRSRWKETTLGQVAQIFGGLTKNPKRAVLPRQLPYLRVANVYANELRLEDIESIGVADSELQKLLLKAGDLLIVEGNGSKDQIGRLAIWDGSIDPCVHQNHLIKLRLTEHALPKWVLFWLLSPRGRKHIEEVSSSTSGLYTLSINKVGALPIVLPPLAEQRQIVAEVERRSEIGSGVDRAISKNFQRAERFRRSILEKCFTPNKAQ